MYGEIWGIIVIFILLVAGICGLGYLTAESACRQQWEHSGFKSEFGFIKGCMITMPDGKTIPADSYREVP